MARIRNSSLDTVTATVVVTEAIGADEVGFIANAVSCSDSASADTSPRRLVAKFPRAALVPEFPRADRVPEFPQAAPVREFPRAALVPEFQRVMASLLQRNIYWLNRIFHLTPYLSA